MQAATTTMKNQSTYVLLFFIDTFCLSLFLLQDDQTPLHISSRLGKPDIVQQLLAKGACPDATTNSGYTPLHLAAREGHRDIAAALLDQAANLSVTTKVKSKHNIYDFFLQMFADHCCNHYGSSTLVLAACIG